jgi:hypothetical protein
MVDQRSSAAEAAIATAWLLSRPFAWTWAGLGYIAYSLFPGTATASRKQEHKQTVEAEILRQSMQAQIDACGVKLAAGRAKQDALMVSASEAQRKGDRQQALLYMRQVHEQRKTTQFVEGVQQQTQQQLAAMDQAEMVKDVADGQERVAKAMSRTNLAKKLDGAEDAMATIAEVTEDVQELCGVLTGPVSDNDEELLQELRQLAEMDSLTLELEPGAEDIDDFEDCAQEPGRRPDSVSVSVGPAPPAAARAPSAPQSPPPSVAERVALLAV